MVTIFTRIHIIPTVAYVSIFKHMMNLSGQNFMIITLLKLRHARRIAS